MGKQHSLAMLRPAHQGTNRPTGATRYPAAALSSRLPRAISAPGGRQCTRTRAVPSAAREDVSMAAQLGIAPASQ
jgi:hypothetical protein